MSSKILNIGLIGLDTSHVIAFAKCFNDPNSKERVEGGRITTGFPGASADFDASKNRVEGFTKDLREQYGVKIVDSPEAVAEASDLVIMSSVDGRRHLGFFKQIMGAKKPVFIDKPLATTSADAREIARLAEAAGLPVMTSSSLRYDEDLERVMAESAADPANPITGVDVFGAMPLAPPMPHWVWYGIHGVEIIMRVMGPGCKRVHAMGDKSYDLLTLQWGDGRGATLRGNRDGHWKFGATIQKKNDYVHIELAGRNRSMAARMLDAVMGSLPQGKSAVPLKESVEIIRILEAADQSRDGGGKTVEI